MLIRRGMVRNRMIGTSLSLFLVTMVFLFIGCADQSTIPTAASGSFGRDVVDDNQGGQPGGDTVFVACDTVSQSVGSNGGKFSLHIQGKKVDFEVPEGALANTVTITIIGTRYRVKNFDFYTYECGPSGLQFAVPLELTQLINRPDGAVANLYYFDDSVNDGDGTGWELQAPVTIQGKLGTFLISHFSKYGISYVAESPLGDFEDADEAAQ